MSLTPIFVIGFENYSVFTLTIGRFLNSLMLESIIIIFLIYLDYKNRSKLFKINSNRDSQSQYLSFNLLLKYFLIYHPNEINNKFFNTKRIFHYFLIGVDLIVFSIPFYYFGFKLVGVSITTIFISCFTIITITIINITRKEEDFNILSITYIILILTSVILIGFGRYNLSININIIGGIPYLIIGIAAWILFILLTERSSNQPNKLITIPKSLPDLNQIESKRKKIQLIDKFFFLNRTKYTNIIYSIIQNFYVHLFGITSIVVFCLILYFIPSSSIINVEIRSFFQIPFSEFVKILFNFKIFMTGFLCTVIAYLFLFGSASIWPPNALKYSQWNSILTVVEPTIGLYIGFFIGNELIRIDYLILTTILLISSLLIRYFYELKALMNLIIFLKLKIGLSKSYQDLFNNLLKFKEVKLARCITGADWDVYIELDVRSINRFYKICDLIQNNEVVKNLKYYFISS